MKRNPVLDKPLPPVETTRLDVWLSAYADRLEAVAEQYGLSMASPAFTAALAVARDYVPGFRVRRKPGARSTLDKGARDLILCMEMLRVELEDRPGGVETAAYDLAVRWEAKGHKTTGPSLAARYYKIKKTGVTPAMKRAAEILARDVQPIPAPE